MPGSPGADAFLAQNGRGPPSVRMMLFTPAESAPLTRLSVLAQSNMPLPEPSMSAHVAQSLMFRAQPHSLEGTFDSQLVTSWLQRPRMVLPAWLEVVMSAVVAAVAGVLESGLTLACRPPTADPTSSSIMPSTTAHDTARRILVPLFSMTKSPRIIPTMNSYYVRSS